MWVIDTSISPGQVNQIHPHRWPAFLYILSWSDFIRYELEGNIMFNSRKLLETISQSTAIWSEQLKPHALENICENNIHIISVEIKIQ